MVDAIHEQPTGIAALDLFRILVRTNVRAAIARDGHHKRYEGMVSYCVNMPPVVDWRTMPDPMGVQPPMQAEHVLRLYCYVLGPAREYEWKGATMAEVFAKATEEFMGWVKEAEEEE